MADSSISSSAVPRYARESSNKSATFKLGLEDFEPAGRSVPCNIACELSEVCSMRPTHGLIRRRTGCLSSCCRDNRRLVVGFRSSHYDTYIHHRMNDSCAEIMFCGPTAFAVLRTLFLTADWWLLRFSSQAARHIHLGHTDTEGRWSVFGQAFRQVGSGSR